MTTSKFPRQLLEVGIPFYRKLYFSEQSNYFISIRKVEKTWKLSTITKGEANILLVNLHGPHWAISSHERDWTQHPSQMWDGAKPKVQDTPNCWQGFAVSTHAASRKGNGHGVNIPKQSAQHLRHAKQKIIFWTQKRKSEPKTYNAKSIQDQSSFKLREQGKPQPRPCCEDWGATKVAILAPLWKA